MKRHSVGFVSLGCPKNLVDTERMISWVSDAGLKVTGNTQEADIVVINTCGFLEPAKNESMDTIREFSDLKSAGSLRGLIVTGCMTERYLNLMQTAYPSVDAFLQTKDFSKVAEVSVEILNNDQTALLARRKILGETQQLQGHSEITDFVQREPGRRSFAYVKIAEGCNRTCSFCIIPKLRGKLHSRSIEGVVDEVKQLVAHGTKEVIFIAQDLTSYGRDRNDQASLLSLLKAIEEIDGLHWFRLMYNYPRFFSDELIAFLKDSKKFSRYLDIPFQHASDAILKAMNRPESRADIRTLIQKLRAAMPDLSLRTTVMVGFPGETDEDFEQLLSFVEEAQFDHLGAFTYFQEVGTPSADLPSQVDELTKKKRYDQLMKAQKVIQKKRLKRWLGRQGSVVIDAFSEKTPQGLVYMARHSGQAPEIDGLTYVVSDRELSVSEITTVEFAKVVGDYDLLAAASNS